MHGSLISLGWIDYASLSIYFAFVILIGVLIFRPSGIMGKSAEDKA